VEDGGRAAKDVSEKSRSRSRSRGRGRRGGEDSGDEPEYEMRRARRPRRRRREKDDDDDDIYVSDVGLDDEVIQDSDQEAEPTRRDRELDLRHQHENRESSDQPRRPERRVDTTPNSVWWWGPLKRWRLKDSTTY
jgi:hypothetical protein